jgi:hypothetical protein
MKKVVVEFVRLYSSTGLPSVPWKFLITDKDDFWPIGWLLYPVDGTLWLVKKESPKNIYAKESMELVGVKVNGELVFEEPEWNNEVIQIWSKGQIISLFEDVVRRKYSGVALDENWTNEEKEKAESWHKLRWVVKKLREDERALKYGGESFIRYVERYYRLAEFRELFEKLAKMKEEERVRFLDALKESLEQEGFMNGFFMYVWYP